MPLNYGRLQKWSKQVRSSKGNVCALCGSEPDGSFSKRIEAHHLITKEEREDLIYDLRNGVPLRRKCHTAVHGGQFFMGLDNYQGKEERTKAMYQAKKEMLKKCMDEHGWTYPADPPLQVIANK